jgi:hypothetical protein
MANKSLAVALIMLIAFLAVAVSCEAADAGTHETCLG